MGFLDALSPKKRKTEALIEEAKAWVKEVGSRGKLISAPTAFLLGKDEHAYYDAPTELRETRAVRHYNAGHAGIRIMKGMYLGRTVGTSESEQQLRSIDKGQLLVTNKRLIFNGNKENRIIPLDKIILIKPYLDGVEISSENRNKGVTFTVKNSFILKALIEMIVELA